ncbi:bifunctional DNA primase/polymerase [Streptomyces polyrhachis]|uniref:Bifunctional DNA primase/polymerase n=1 Tax=Streptomyces polyrhachis TaxID=1282885 RepID=A0ABW2GD76_9ACTN
MRETPGRRMRRRLGLPGSTGSALPAAAFDYAAGFGWRVLPGASPAPRREPEVPFLVRRAAARPAPVRCSCPVPDCPQPGAHPLDPPLPAATADPRMVRWWWRVRPQASLLLATGGRGPSAVSLPAPAGAQALRALDRRGVRTGPVVATPQRWALLVAPYSLAELGELLYELEWVPPTLRFHGDGGYLALPPTTCGAARTHWERPPQTGPTTAPWLPEVSTVINELVAAGAAMSPSEQNGR